MEAIDTIHLDLLDRITSREDLRTSGVTGFTSTVTHEAIGEYRELIGFNIDKAVAVELQIANGDDISDLRWLSVFSRTTSLAPHLLIELESFSNADAERVGLLVDLIPRIDLAVNLEYVDEVYQPLTSMHRSVTGIDGVTFGYVPPRRAVAMSAWRLSLSIPSSGIDRLTAILDGYLDRWIALTSGGVAADIDPLARDQARLVQHDRFHRNTLFDPESDPRWDRIDRVIGIDAAAELRTTLRSQRER